MSPRRAFLMAVGLGWALGCVTFDYTGTRCSGDQECPSGYVCKGGLCTTDGGATVADAGTPDAGAVCTSGCVDHQGACQPGTANDACGETGTCVACGAALKCTPVVNAQRCLPRCGAGCFDPRTNGCVLPGQQVQSACGPATGLCQDCTANAAANICLSGTGCVVPSGCGGCVSAQNLCVTAPDNQQCGTSGTACTACPTGRACQNGQCVATTCNGCVDGSTCRAGLVESACGSNGMTCATCLAVERCAASGGGRKCEARCPVGCVSSTQTCRTIDQDVTACGRDNSLCTSCPVPPAGQSYVCAAGDCVLVKPDAGTAVDGGPTPDAGTALWCDNSASSLLVRATPVGIGITTYQLSAPVTQVAAADLDGDGLDEVVVVHPGVGLHLLRNVNGTLENCALYNPGVAMGPVTMTVSGGTARVYFREQTSGKVYQYTWNPLTEAFPGTLATYCAVNGKSYAVRAGAGTLGDTVWCGTSTGVDQYGNNQLTAHWSTAGAAQLLLLPNAINPKVLVANLPDAGLQAIDLANADGGVVAPLLIPHGQMFSRLTTQAAGTGVYEFIGARNAPPAMELCEVNTNVVPARLSCSIINAANMLSTVVLDVGLASGNPGSTDEALLGVQGTTAQALTGKMTVLSGSATFTANAAVVLHDWASVAMSPGSMVGAAAHLALPASPRTLPSGDDAVLGFDTPQDVNLITVH